MTVSKILLLIAVILFVLVGLKVDDAAALKDFSVLGLGLAFFAASFLVP